MVPRATANSRSDNLSRQGRLHAGRRKGSSVTGGESPRRSILIAAGRRHTRTAQGRVSSREKLPTPWEYATHSDPARWDYPASRLSDEAHPNRISGYRRIERFKNILELCIRLSLPLLDRIASTMVSPFIVHHGILRKAKSKRLPCRQDRRQPVGAL
jgi:hypothetical protein